MSRHDHSEGAIQLLDWRDAVRRRPAMYIRGLDELIVLCVRDAIERGARHVAIQLEGSGAFVSHDAAASFEAFVEPFLGRWWPAPLSALSARMAIEVCAGGRRQSAVFARGHQLGPVRDHGATDRVATRMSLMVDPEIFGERRFDPAAVRRPLEALCLGQPQLRVRLDGAPIHDPRGLSGVVARLAGETTLHPHPLRFAGYRRGVQVDIALQWRAARASEIRCYVGALERDSQVIAAFRVGLLEAARRSEISDAVVAELLEPGLVALVAVDGSMDDADLAGAVREVTREGLRAHRRVIDRVITARGRSTLAG